MKFISILAAATTVASQDTFPCSASADCRTEEILAALNEKYADLGDITFHSAVCMTISGQN